MAKIIRMPKLTAEAAAVAPDGHSEHILRYPRSWRGSHFADFMRDKRMTPEVYHCVIQRDGSKDILSWTQHSTLEAAMEHAEVELALIAGSTAAEA